MEKSPNSSERVLIDACACNIFNVYSNVIYYSEVQISLKNCQNIFNDNGGNSELNLFEEKKNILRKMGS